MKIPFHRPLWSGKEIRNIERVFADSDGAGDGYFTQQVEKQLKRVYGTDRLLLAASASLALEMAMRLLDLKTGDEVIMPSFNFPSAANAVLLAGGRPVFVETGEDLMLDPRAVNRAITDRTKGILVVHYGGAVAGMEALEQIAADQELWIVEDAAQAFGAVDEKGRPAGTIGDFGVVSFHGTKVVSAGEGGLLLVNRNDDLLWEKANRFHQKGTDRKAFLAGKTARYSWQGLGVSACPSELQMAVLAEQLHCSESIIEQQRRIWRRYQDAFSVFSGERFILSPKISQNGHIFWLKFLSAADANAFRQWMGDHGVAAYTHFVPLHSTDFGKAFCGKDQKGLIQESSYQTRVVRLPIFASLKEAEVDYIIDCARDYFKEYRE